MLKKFFLLSTIISVSLFCADKDKEELNKIKQEKQKIFKERVPGRLIAKAFVYSSVFWGGYKLLADPTHYPNINHYHRYLFPSEKARIILPFVALYLGKKCIDHVMYGPGSTFRGRSTLLNSYNYWKRLDDKQNEIEARLNQDEEK